MKKLLIFFAIGFIASMIFLINTENSLTGFTVSHSSSDNNSYFDINIEFPPKKWSGEELKYFVFEINESGFCKIYTTYRSGSWTNFPSENTVLMPGEQIIAANFNKPGEYDWNLYCTNFDSNNKTWASKNDYSFTIINKTNTTQNQTLEENNQSEQNNDYEESKDNEQNNQSENNISQNNDNQQLNTSTNNTNNISTNLLNNTSNMSNNQINTNNTKKCVGCTYNNNCFLIGTINKDTAEYCAKPNQFKPLKSKNSQCNYDYECGTENCLNNKCRKDNFWTKFLNAFGFI